MSIKGIIILDKPKVCIDCPCHFFDDTLWCGITKKEIESEDIETCKPDWCPIKEIPKKNSLDYRMDEFDIGYDAGYNYFVDWMLGDR